MGNSLDTDDIVALSYTIPDILLMIALIVVAWVISTKYLKKYTKRILQLRDKNIGQRKGKDGKMELYHKPILQVLAGDQNYEAFMTYIKSKNGGKEPSLQEIDQIIAPETLFTEIYFNVNPN